ncbi:hypothetical protein BGZ98_004201 [Dissophora globulifera]|nr:hypothetical protein BGZ98_004201 [Dissophora globulifera]
MATLHSPTTRIPQNSPQHTFMDQKQPLLPRQSTSDVLSFTHIIANRLAPGQSVWEFFSPPPPPAAPSDNCLANGLPPLSPTMAMERTNSSSSSRLGLSNPCPGFQSSMASMPSPTSPELPSIAQRFSSDAGSHFASHSDSRRQSLTVRVDRQVPMTLTENCSNEQKQKLARCKIDGDNNDAEGDSSSSPSSFTPSSPTPSSLSLLPLPAGLMTGDVVDDTAAAAAIHPPRTTAAGELPMAPLVPLTTTATLTTTSQNSATVATSTSATVTAAEASTTAAVVVERETPKLQKRRSFAQSLKNSMLSLTQLLSPVSSISSSASSTRVSSPSTEAMNMSTRTTTAAAAAMTTVNRHGGPHYNILVLGSDSAPLASTLYKMSSLLPGTSKIRHYQEISGFFVAHFRSDEPSPPPSSTSSSSTSPLLSTGLKEDINQSSSMECGTASARSSEETLSVSSQLRTSSTHSTITEATHSSSCSGDKLVEDACFISEKVVRGLTVSADDPGPTNTGNEDAETVVQDDESSACQDLNQDPSLDNTSSSASPSSSPGGSLSLHAFSLDTMWPVPRTLAQTFWFPYAHGIIFIVDATRKHDPRAVDHLLNARQFLTSLVSDPHFCRQDIPVTVFANKAGSDPETCYRLDEIAEILGCEEWDVCSASAAGGASPKRARPWCVKSTKADGEGDGIRESVEWLKSRMGEVWSTPE